MEPPNAESIEQRVAALEWVLSEVLCDIVLLKGEADKSAHRLQSLEGANVKRDSDPEPDVEPPYRMTRPTNRDALVIDGGKVWRPVFGPDGMWEADDDSDWVAWEVLTDPQPFQNCTLTANDLEPPEGSLILDSQRLAHQRHDEYWYGPADSHADKMDVRWWSQLDFPVTLLYRGRK